MGNTRSRIRGVLSRHGGTIRFRDDWTKIEPAELWNSAKITMAAINNVLAAPLITDIDTAWAAILVPAPAPAPENAAIGFRLEATPALIF